MYRAIYILFIWLAGASLAFGVANPKKPEKLQVVKYRIDSTHVEQRHLDKAAIDRYRKDPDFNYAVVKPEENWWDRFWDGVWNLWNSFWAWVGRLFEKLFGHTAVGKGAASVFRLIVVLSFAGMIIYVISRLAGIDLLKLLRKNQRIDEMPYSELIEDIHQIDFEKAVESAIAVKDYRLAVRLLYLRSLKQLSDANLIKWQLEKTNYTYLNELKDTEQRRRFSVVTRQFEYVWYGDFPVDGQSFQAINASFIDLKQAVS